MRRILSIILTLAIALTACVTGNDDNLTLQQHNDAISKTPRVLDLRVNGEAPTRDDNSMWEYFIVNPGDQIRVTANINSGKDANSSTLFFTRFYYHTSTTFEDIEEGADGIGPVGDNSEIEFEFPAGSTPFDFTFTVPAQDDDDLDFISGDHINIAFYTFNDINGVGYNDFTLEYE